MEVDDEVADGVFAVDKIVVVMEVFVVEIVVVEGGSKVVFVVTVVAETIAPTRPLNAVRMTGKFVILLRH